jgi:hypothetical protein
MIGKMSQANHYVHSAYPIAIYPFFINAEGDRDDQTPYAHVVLAVSFKKVL